MSENERQFVRAALYDTTERENEELGRHGAAMWELREEIASLVLRGKHAGLSHKQMAEALSGELGKVTHQRVQVIVQEAEQAASRAVSQLVEDARVDELMRDRGISEREAREIVLDEKLAAQKAAIEADRAKAAELVAFVEAIGDGVELRDDRASEILYRFEQGWSDAKLARLVEDRFHGRVGHKRREEVARRVVAFARELSVPAA
jgi:hypothetical protein